MKLGWPVAVHLGDGPCIARPPTIGTSVFFLAILAVPASSSGLALLFAFIDELAT